MLNTYLDKKNYKVILSIFRKAIYYNKNPNFSINLRSIDTNVIYNKLYIQLFANGLITKTGLGIIHNVGNKVIVLPKIYIAFIILEKKFFIIYIRNKDL